MGSFHGLLLGRAVLLIQHPLDLPPRQHEGLVMRNVHGLEGAAGLQRLLLHLIDVLSSLKARATPSNTTSITSEVSS